MLDVRDKDSIRTQWSDGSWANRCLRMSKTLLRVGQVTLVAVGVQRTQPHAGMPRRRTAAVLFRADPDLIAPRVCRAKCSPALPPRMAMKKRTTKLKRSDICIRGGTREKPCQVGTTWPRWTRATRQDRPCHWRNVAAQAS